MINEIGHLILQDSLKGTKLQEASAEYSDSHPLKTQGKQDSYEEPADTAYILDPSLYFDILVSFESDGHSHPKLFEFEPDSEEVVVHDLEVQKYLKTCSQIPFSTSIESTKKADKWN